MQFNHNNCSIHTTMPKGGKYVVTEDSQQLQPQSRCQRVCRTIWNSETGLLFGRKPISWGKLLVFYFTYYVVLAGFFASALAVTFRFISEEFPNYYHNKSGMESHILFNPGMEFVPNIIDFTSRKLLSPPVRFNKDVASTYQKYLDVFASFLEPYDDDTETFTLPSYCNVNDVASTCNVSLSQLGPCDLNTNPQMGFDQGEPCILLKMNRVINWKANLYTTTPGWKKPHTTFDAESIGLSCTELTERGKEVEPTNFDANQTKFYPESGFASTCFPFCGKVKSPNYLNQLVAVKVAGLQLNKEVHMYCRTWIRGLQPSSRDLIGSIRFSVQLDTT